MRVKEIMTDNIQTTSPDATLRQAAEAMKKLNVGALPVVSDGLLIGMVTDRDLVVRAIAEGREPAVARVKEAMSADVICCFEDQDVQEAAKLMKQKQLRRIPVVNRETKPVGILSLGDLAVQTKDAKLAGGVLQQVSM